MHFHFFNFRKNNLKIYMCGCFICVCMCLYTTCVFGACGGQKKVSDFLELDFQMKKSYHCRLWESHLGPLQEQQALLTNKPSLQLLIKIFKYLLNFF